MPDDPRPSESFERALEPALRGLFGKGAELDAALAAVLDSARAAWPRLEVDATQFAAHLGAHLRADSELARLHVADLYLAFACLLGDPHALTEVDQVLSSGVPAVFGQLPAGLTPDEVLQRLRLKLFVRSGEAPPAIAGYSGRGALVQWLRAAAVRVIQDFARRGAGRHEAATSDDALIETPAAGHDADLQYLKGRYAAEFKAAFQETLKELSPRDLNLLRLSYLDGVSPEEIGRIYQTHRTTVWRWLGQCREALLTGTRRRLAERVKVSEGELSSLMNAVHSQLDVSISRMLGRG
ncbi:MAG: sigma-70 family RNA polymerase sigma factor [Archangiaceae bacterium]|nr:sigma-70 family RNA polymerase sigma factor [Archangiaceae bacterium]